MTKAMSMIAAIPAAAALCLAAVWLGHAGLAWIAANPEIVAVIQPWSFPFMLILVALNALQLLRRKA